MHSLHPARARLGLAALLASACATSPAASPEPAGAAPAVSAETTAVVAPPAAPLATLAGQRIALLPTHYFRALDTLNLAGGLMRPNEYLTTIDDELRFALEERGLASRWVMPEGLRRLAKRNPMHAADPDALAAEVLRFGVRRRDGTLPDPLASQLRSLAAIAQVRFLLFPVELRLENAAPGKSGGQALLRLALIDARMAQVRWAGDVHADVEGTPDVPLAATLASRVADLVSPSR